MDKFDKWLYFRTVADMANDDGDTGSDKIAPTSLCVPASSMVAITPASDTTITMSFKSVRLSHDAYTGNMSSPGNIDTVVLTVDQGKTFEVMSRIIQAISSSKRSDNGFIVIADDCTTTDSATTALNDKTIAAQYIHPSITAVGNITCANTSGGYGIHEYFEVVNPATADDDDVAGSLAVKLPAQAVLINAALVPIELATSNHGLLALEFHSAAVADDAASAGTEWVGADTVNLSIQGVTNAAGTKDVDNTSTPDADCDLDATAGVLGKGVFSGVADPVARGTDETFFHVTAKEDLSSMTGTPKVGVYIKWLGYKATKITA